MQAINKRKFTEAKNKSEKSDGQNGKTIKIDYQIKLWVISVAKCNMNKLTCYIKWDVCMYFVCDFEAIW